MTKSPPIFWQRTRHSNGNRASPRRDHRRIADRSCASASVIQSRNARRLVGKCGEQKKRANLDRTTEPRDATLRSPQKEMDEGLAEIGPPDRLLWVIADIGALRTSLATSGRPGRGTDRTARKVRMSNLSGARRQSRLLTARLIAAEQAATPLRNVPRATIIARIEWMLYGDDLDRPPRAAAILERRYGAAHCATSPVTCNSR